MNDLTFSAIPKVLSVIISLALAIYIFGQNPKSAIHRIFSAECFLIVFWTLIDFAVDITKDIQLRFFWVKCGFFWPMFIGILLHFSLSFSEQTGTRFGKILLKIGYISGSVLSVFEFILTFGNNGSIVRLHWLLQYKIPGWEPFYSIETIWMIGLIILTIIIQIRYYRHLTDRLKKTKAKIIIVGTIIAASSSSLAAGFSGILYPDYIALVHLIPLVGNMIITYGIIRHDLFVINTAMASENIISTMTDALFLINSKKEIISMNNSAALLTGYSRSELSGVNLSLIFADRHIFTYIMDSLFKNGKIVSADMKAKKKDKTIVFVSISASVLENNKTVIGAVCLLRDISERVRLLDEKANMDQHLVQFEKMKAIGQLAGGIAHDFNNCLAAILLSAQETRDRFAENNNELAELTDNILGASRYGRDLAEKLLSFSRKEQQSRNAVDIHIIIQRVITLLKHTVSKKIVIQKELEAELSIVMGDSLQIQNSIINIALNGCDAMDEEGGILLFRTNIINIETELFSPFGRLKAGRFISIGIIDNGMGMDENTKNRMFEPFFTTKPVGKGTGLGLSSVYKVVQNYEGMIDVASIVNRGTTFTIYLPLLPENQIDRYEEDNNG